MRQQMPDLQFLITVIKFADLIVESQHFSVQRDQGELRNRKELGHRRHIEQRIFIKREISTF